MITIISLFRNMPIKRKLMIITMLTCCLALLMACSVFLLYETMSYRQHMVDQLNTITGITGDNSAAALSFDDSGSAEKALQSLSHIKSISAAAIYNAEGKLFAKYDNFLEGLFIPPAVQHDTQRFTADYAERFRDIELAGEVIGVIYLRHDMKELHALQRNYLMIVGIVLLAVSMVSWCISSRLQRIISVPVGSLAAVVAHVSQGKDYSVRAIKQSEDELGQLIDGFNGMLDQIQHRDIALQAAQDELENRVQERTAELEYSLAMLNATLESTADGIFAVRYNGQMISCNNQFIRMWKIPPELIERGNSAEMMDFVIPQMKDPEQFKLGVQALFANEGAETYEVIEFLDGRIFERHIKPQRVHGKSIGMVINFRDVTEHKQTEAILRDSKNFLNSALDALSAHIAIIDENGIIVKTNAAWNRFARENGYPDDHHGLGQCYLTVFSSANDDSPQEGSEVAAGIRAVMAGLTSEFQLEYPCHSPTEQRWFVVRATRFEGEGPTRVVVAHENITARIRAEAELEKSLRALLESSRLAGMSEVATSVLHNVGNVLNSVNISCSVVADLVRKSRIDSVAKTAALLQQHEADLTSFFGAEGTGRKLPSYLAQLAARLSTEQSMILTELGLLDRNIEHIKDIVSAQQNYAKNLGGIRETLPLESLVEDALRMNSAALTRHHIEVIRNFCELPPIQLEKHKVLQILVNLLRNAKHALRDNENSNRRMTISITRHNDCVAVSVSDNGVGITADDLPRVFSHGFTTKQDGHGFGLHSGILAAQEMGGRLTVHSDGPGLGAFFTLELPLIAAEKPIK